MENHFAEHIRPSLCQCVIPEKAGSRFLEILDADDISRYTYRPVHFDGSVTNIGEPRRLFKLKNMEKCKENEPDIRDIFKSFHLQVFGNDITQCRGLTTRMIYRPKPVLWNSLKTLEMLETTGAGEPDVFLIEHNDLLYVRASDVTDQQSYDNSLKYQLRFSALVQNLKYQKKFNGFFKLPSDSPLNECVPPETNMRGNLHDWSWLMQMKTPISKFVEDMDRDLKTITIGELRVQKKEIGKFQRSLRLGDASWYMSQGETSRYINYMHELVQLTNSVLCQALQSLEYALDIYSAVNKDFYKLLEDLIDT